MKTFFEFVMKLLFLQCTWSKQIYHNSIHSLIVIGEQQIKSLFFPVVLELVIKIQQEWVEQKLKPMELIAVAEKGGMLKE